MVSHEMNLNEHIIFEIRKRFGIITFNREEKGNALTIKMIHDIKNLIEHCQKNEKIRGIILTGKGNAFTTGLDLNSIDPSNHVEVKEIEATAGKISKLLFYGKPVISAINGYAMGDGVIYALASDYRIAVKEAFFQMPEINYGIFPGTGAMVLASRIIGIPWTRRIFMFSERISSKIAYDINLIDQIVEDKENLIQATMEKAKFLFTKNQTVLNAIKLCSNHLLDKSYKNAYELEKLGSDWYEYENKEHFLELLRKKFY